MSRRMPSKASGSDVRSCCSTSKGSASSVAGCLPTTCMSVGRVGDFAPKSSPSPATSPAEKHSAASFWSAVYRTRPPASAAFADAGEASSAAAADGAALAAAAFAAPSPPSSPTPPPSSASAASSATHSSPSSSPSPSSSSSSAASPSMPSSAVGKSYSGSEHSLPPITKQRYLLCSPRSHSSVPGGSTSCVAARQST